MILLGAKQIDTGLFCGSKDVLKHGDKKEMQGISREWSFAPFWS